VETEWPLQAEVSPPGWRAGRPCAPPCANGGELRADRVGKSTCPPPAVAEKGLRPSARVIEELVDRYDVSPPDSLPSMLPTAEIERIAPAPIFFIA